VKTISLPVYKRPGRVKRLLETLRACKPDGYTLYVSAEPGHQDVLDVIGSIDFMPFHVSINKERLGLNGNIKNALFAVMRAGSSFNVALEDDIVLAPDALQLADWYAAYPGRNTYACLGLLGFFPSTCNPLEIGETQDFRSWGWCCTRESWVSHILPGLDFDPGVHGGKYSHLWDFRLQAYLVQKGVKTLHPLLTRSNHEGSDDGSTDLDPELVKHFKNPAMSAVAYGSDFFVTRPSGRVTLDPVTRAFIPVREKVSA
jgi:hypothetical protein